jgi:Mn-dependent DtxR family transcriptional regulator
MLTARGLESGRELVRKHRLWETYLARDLGLPADHLHAPAHREEHFIAGELLEVLEREVEVGVDPHGRPIPGRMASTVEHPSMRRPGSV